MKKKLFIASFILVPVLAVGTCWQYQADYFDKSIKQQVIDLQENFKEKGVSFTYDAIKVSRLWFKVHLVNPVVSGTLSNLPAEMKDLEGLKGTYSIKEVVGSFSPFTNALTFTCGDSHIKIDGPAELDMYAPESKGSKIVIKRKDYDFFGKNSFLSLDNIKGIYSQSKEMPIYWNGQKIFYVKDAQSDVSFDSKGKGLDLTLNYHAQQLQYFKIDKLINSNRGGLEDINAAMSNWFISQSALGPQDQKISLTMHVTDAEDYMKNLKAVYEKIRSKESVEDFGKLFPEGMQFLVKDYSDENKIYQVSMKGKAEKLKDKLPVEFSIDFKVTDQWEAYWKESHNSFLTDLAMLNDGLMSILKREDVWKSMMPHLQSFGKMSFNLNFEIPQPFSFTEGKAVFEFNSDLYALGIKGELGQQEGTSIKINTRNATAIMADVDQYVSRASAAFAQMYSNEILTIKNSIQLGHGLVNKVLEPTGASEQAVTILVNKEGVKVGKYNIGELLATLGPVIH